jgi:2-aminoadipate transaminase
LPVRELAEVLGSAVTQPKGLDYGWARGEAVLLEQVARFFDLIGVPRRPAVVVGGATQGLFLALYALASPGDTVLTDAATYSDALSCCASLGLRTLGVEDDEQGMVPEALERSIGDERAAGRRPAAIYMIPTAHNPLGMTLGTERRDALVAIARRHGVAIVEDETYALFDGTEVPRLSALAPELVIRLDSLSKVLGPGLRIGWISGPDEVMDRVNQLKAAVDVCASVPLQRAVATLLPEIRDLAAPQLRGLEERRAALLGSLDEHFGGLCRWTRPRGGYFVWMDLCGRCGSMDLFRAGLKAGVAVLPGAIFSPHRLDTAVRLGCANRTPAELREGVARLRRAYDTLLSGDKSG